MDDVVTFPGRMYAFVNYRCAPPPGRRARCAPPALPPLACSAAAPEIFGAWQCSGGASGSLRRPAGPAPGLPGRRLAPPAHAACAACRTTEEAVLATTELQDRQVPDLTGARPAGPARPLPDPACLPARVPACSQAGRLLIKHQPRSAPAAPHGTLVPLPLLPPRTPPHPPRRRPPPADQVPPRQEGGHPPARAGAGGRGGEGCAAGPSPRAGFMVAGCPQRSACARWGWWARTCAEEGARKLVRICTAAQLRLRAAGRGGPQCRLGWPTLPAPRRAACAAGPAHRGARGAGPRRQLLRALAPHLARQHRAHRHLQVAARGGWGPARRRVWAGTRLARAAAHERQRLACLAARPPGVLAACAPPRRAAAAAASPPVRPPPPPALRPTRPSPRRCWAGLAR